MANLSITDKADFAKFIKTIQSMKSRYIMIEGNTIYGTNETFAILKRIDYPGTMYLMSGVYEIGVIDSIGKTFGLVKDQYTESELEWQLNLPIVPAHLYNSFKENQFKIHNILFENRLLYHEDNLKSRKDFQQILSMKSSDGIGLLKINEKVVMTLFKTILPVNVADKVALNVYHVDENRFLAEFIIVKAKGIILKEYLMYLYI